MLVDQHQGKAVGANALRQLQTFYPYPRHANELPTPVLGLGPLGHSLEINAQLFQVERVLIHHATSYRTASRAATSRVTRSHITLPRGSR